MIDVLQYFTVKKVEELAAREHYQKKFPEAKFVVISKSGLIFAVTTTEQEAQEVISKVNSIK